jgi:hypothetical protein
VFAERRALSQQRDPIQGEFFNVDAIRSPVTALVREAIQNSLDAQVHRPVTVRVHVSGVKGALPPAVVEPFSRGLRPHIAACSAEARALFDGPCAFVAIEDFNTAGLRGDPAQCDEPAPDEAGDFFYFFRAEGKSGKSGSDRGRWRWASTSSQRSAA